MGLKIISYNCRSIKSNLHCIKTLCETADLICLQETWLPLQELNFLNTISKEFSFYATSPVDLSSQLLVGRPYGGEHFYFAKILLDQSQGWKHQTAGSFALI